MGVFLPCGRRLANQQSAIDNQQSAISNSLRDGL
jgi:hypothetical protein